MSSMIRPIDAVCPLRRMRALSLRRNPSWSMAARARWAGPGERVRAAIDQLGFRRNDSARILRKGQTASIGLIMEDIGNPFYSVLSRAVEDVAREHGHVLFTGSSDEDPVRERELALAFCARRVDGLVVIPAADDHTYLLPEMAAGIATVFVDRPARLIEADTVLINNVGGARDGVNHLIS